MYSIEPNKYLRPARLIRLSLGELYGEAIVSFTSGTNTVNIHNLRREIYRHLEAVGWERFRISTLRATETGVVVYLNRQRLKPEAEAWTSFLGGVLSLPPEV